MDKKVIIAIVIGIGLMITVAIAFEYKTNPNRPSSAAVNIVNFVVLKEGMLYTTRFSLYDKSMRETTASGHVSIMISDMEDTILYGNEFYIKAADFSIYKYLLTGETFWAYAWNFPIKDVQVSENMWNIGIAEISFTMPDGTELTSTYELVSLP